MKWIHHDTKQAGGSFDKLRLSLDHTVGNVLGSVVMRFCGYPWICEQSGQKHPKTFHSKSQNLKVKNAEHKC